jgi:hypothetical protein
MKARVDAATERLHQPALSSIEDRGFTPPLHRGGDTTRRWNVPTTSIGGTRPVRPGAFTARGLVGEGEGEDLHGLTLS